MGKPDTAVNPSHGSTPTWKTGLCRRSHCMHHGKADTAEGLLMNTLQPTWKPVCAGGYLVDIWEVRHKGRPTSRIYTYMGSGPCQRPHCTQKGSQAKWTAHEKHDNRRSYCRHMRTRQSGKPCDRINQLDMDNSTAIPVIGQIQLHSL